MKTFEEVCDYCRQGWPVRRMNHCGAWQHQRDEILARDEQGRAVTTRVSTVYCLASTLREQEGGDTGRQG